MSCEVGTQDYRCNTDLITFSSSPPWKLTVTSSSPTPKHFTTFVLFPNPRRSGFLTHTNYPVVGFGSAGNRKSSYYIRRPTPPVIGVRWDVLGSIESHMRSPHASKTDQGYVVAADRRVKEGMPE